MSILNELKEIKKDIVDIKESMYLDQLFLFYIGDIMHNFGIDTWTKTDKDFSISHEDQQTVSEYFCNVKLISNPLNKAGVKFPLSVIIQSSTFDKENYLSSDLKEDIKNYEKYNFSEIELKELLYRFVLLKGNHIMEIVSGDISSLKEDIQKIKTIQDLFTTKYGPVFLDKNEEFVKKFN